MRILLEAGVVWVALLSGAVATLAWWRNRRTAGVNDHHRHKWTAWKVTGTREVHLYSEVDEGADLPDRVDATMERQCVRCGLPQYKTVRGIDSPHWK